MAQNIFQNEVMQNLRLNVGHLSKLVFAFAVLPLSVGVALDIATGLLPFITIVTVVIFIPLASFIVTRAVMADFNRIIDLVAPEEPIVEELLDDSSLSS